MLIKNSLKMCSFCFFFECYYCYLLALLCLTLWTPWTVAHQAPLCPWNFPGKNSRVACHFLLQGIFLTQGSIAWHLLLGRHTLYHWATRGALCLNGWIIIASFISYCWTLLSFSCPVMSDSAIPWIVACQASPSLTISWSLSKVMFIASVMLSSHLILCCPLLLLPSIFPASGTFPVSQLFASGDQNTGASASTSALPVNIQGWSFLRLTVLISLLSRDFQESSPAPQFEGINSLVFWLLYGPALTTVWDHWEDRSLDYTDLSRPSNVSAFQITV